MKLKDYLKEQFQDIKGVYQFSSGGSVSIKGSTVKEPMAITPKVGIASSRVGLDQLSRWTNKGAQETVIYVMNWWGTPNVLTHNKAMWFKIAGFDKVCVKDEGVPHVGMGEFHVDYLHCSKDIPVPPEFLSPLAEFLPNVMYDGLKKRVTVRCNDIMINAVTLGFVEDVAAGKEEATSDAYMERVDRVGLPEWFEVQRAWIFPEEQKEQMDDWKERMDRQGGKYGRGYHMRIGKNPMDMEMDLNIKESVNEKTEYVVRAFSNPGTKPTYTDIVFDDLGKAKTNAKNQKKHKEVADTAIFKREGKKLTKISEAFEEIPKGESPDIDWAKLENPDEKEYLNKTLKKVLKTKDPKALKKLKNFHKSGKFHIDWKSLENERDKEYLNNILKEGFVSLSEVAEYYVEFYPEFTTDSIEKGLKAAWKKHEKLDPVTVKYFLTEKRFGGLGFGKEK